MPRLPTGTVTFLFTDIEGSTRLVQQLGYRYQQALEAHRKLLREAILKTNGCEFETQGDAFFVAFASARDAIAAAVTAQRSLRDHPWPEGNPVRVRMGIHTGHPTDTGSGYVGLDLHRTARISAAGHGGQILLSSTTSHLVKETLPAGVALRDLGEHRLKDLARPEHLYQAVAAGLLVDFPALRSLDIRPNNLPMQLTTFIGREREKAEVKGLLSRARLVTLTGPGGTGKTRLALEVAAEMLAQNADGVWLVEVAGLTEPDHIVQSVATLFHVRELRGRLLLNALSESLKNKHLLLVLDDCEHLVAECAHLADALLRVCPYLRILTTSREELGIGGEVIWRVPPLSLPNTRGPSSVDSVSRSEAARLFIERAMAADRTFTATDHNAPAVAQVVQRLEGLPLAIELAAALAPILKVEQIASRLDNRLQILTRGSRTARPRHKTLRAAIDWSHELLSDAERLLLRRLAVFVGGFSLGAAEAICPGADEGLHVLDLLARLYHRSLVVVEERGAELRYRLLETVRQYAREKVLEAGEDAQVRRRHAEWYHALAGQAEAHLQGPDQNVLLDRLETEHDNLRAALDWFLDQGDTEAGLALAASLGWFWFIRGHWSEGREHLTRILDRARPVGSPRPRARALFEAGRLARGQKDYAAARRLHEESLALFQESGDKEGIGWTLRSLGMLARDRKDYATAHELHEESLRLFRELGNEGSVGWALEGLGEMARAQGDYVTAHAHHEASLKIFRALGNKVGMADSLRGLGKVKGVQGDFPAAHPLFEESLSLSRELGDQWGIGETLQALGISAREQGDLSAARALAEESLAIFSALGDKGDIGQSLLDLGLIASRQADYATALALLEESLRIFRTLNDERSVGWALRALGEAARLQGDPHGAVAHLGEALVLLRKVCDKRGIVVCLSEYAGVSSAQGQLRRAATLFGAVEALCERDSVRRHPADQARYYRAVSTLRGGIGEEAFAVAWAEGRRMTLREAIAYAMSVRV